MSKHYTQGKVETIDNIKNNLQTLPVSPFTGYIIGNIYKYCYRYKYKGEAFSDVFKAVNYMNYLVFGKWCEVTAQKIARLLLYDNDMSEHDITAYRIYLTMLVLCSPEQYDHVKEYEKLFRLSGVINDN